MKAIFVAVVLGAMACGGGSTGGEGGGGGSQTCDQKHSCTNGACKCTAGPKDGSSCCDPDDTACTTNKCDTYCKYCQ